MFETIGQFILIIGGIWWLTTTVVITRTKTVKILETFGKYSGTRNAGISLKLPVPFQVCVKTIHLNIQEISMTLDLKTSDNLFINYPVIVQYKVTDAFKAHYELNDSKKQIMSYISNLVRSEVGKRSFLELYAIRDELQDEVKAVLADKMNGYGFEIVDVLVNEPIPTTEVQNAYNSVTSSERQKEAAKNIAEANRIRLVEEAKAQKESKRLQGEGIADQRNAIVKGFKESTESMAQDLGISNEVAVLMILQLNKFDTIRDASAGKATVIITDGSSDSESREMQKMIAGLAALPNLKQDHQSDDTHKQ